ncbi:hypothetical protein WMY93_022592 [Mugilogobius chulae]|uniref:Uncharacterized protein n=1 Tax=Mugilogobius chulae TaxID=88201 RepID=A0AAW0NI00_9GOBI
MQDEENFPPPPPPIYFNEDLGEANASLSASVTSGHVRSNSEPPQIAHIPEDSGPSRFAQAVALAVHRSRLHTLALEEQRGTERKRPSQKRQWLQLHVARPGLSGLHSSLHLRKNRGDGGDRRVLLDDGS